MGQLTVEFISLKLPFVWQNIHFDAGKILSDALTNDFLLLLFSEVICY